MRKRLRKYLLQKIGDDSENSGRTPLELVSRVYGGTRYCVGAAKLREGFRITEAAKENEMSDITEAQLTRIHIDRVAFKSPNPTTGEALYALADIVEHEKLYREVEGDEEDQRVPRDETQIHLTQDEHFYSQKVFDILVNGDDHQIDTGEITYTRVVDLYVGSGGKPSNEYLVKYSHGPVENPSGTLAPGQKVKVKDGMRFRVAGTGES